MSILKLHLKYYCDIKDGDDFFFFTQHFTVLDDKKHNDILTMIEKNGGIDKISDSKKYEIINGIISKGDEVLYECSKGTYHCNIVGIDPDNLIFIEKISKCTEKISFDKLYESILRNNKLKKLAPKPEQIKYQEIVGNLLTLSFDNNFDVIAHGVNCFCTQNSGIALEIKQIFRTDFYPLEDIKYKGDRTKLGKIDFRTVDMCGQNMSVVNAYTQYTYGIRNGVAPVDYDAITSCMRTINQQFKGQRVGLPKIGAGLAGGDWNTISDIIKKELKDCYVTIVILEK